MQMTALQESTWEEDAEQYVADEEEEDLQCQGVWRAAAGQPPDCLWPGGLLGPGGSLALPPPALRAPAGLLVPAEHIRKCLIRPMSNSNITWTACAWPHAIYKF